VTENVDPTREPLARGVGGCARRPSTAAIAAGTLGVPGAVGQGPTEQQTPDAQ
jgi:hypothetical protein